MKNLPRSQIFFLGIFLFLLLSLPVVLFLTTQKRPLDIRPRAEITGAANLLLYPSNSTPLAGDVFDVVVKTQLTNGNLRVSGADFKVLYDKELLEAVNVAPAVGGDKSPFTDVLINKKNESYDGQFNYLWVSEIAKKDDDKLAGGFVQLAAVKFRAKKEGSSAIKFPDNSELQIVGIDLGIPIPTPSAPTCVPRPPCADGIKDENGNIVYCDPGPGVIWCPKLTSTPTPTPIACNYSVNPPITCPSGYECQSPGIPGASGVCVKNTPTPGGCNERCCCVKNPIYDKSSSFNCGFLTSKDACTSIVPTQVCKWVCRYD